MAEFEINDEITLFYFQPWSKLNHNACIRTMHRKSVDFFLNSVQEKYSNRRKP